MSGTNQYVLYTALLLGSIGAYGAYGDSLTNSNSSAEGLFSEAISNGDVSSADLTSVLTELGKKVDENSY